MNVAEALAACEATVRQSDPDRYFASLFAPAERRPLLFALYAFHHEIARVAASVREPMMGEIRRQWWREAIETAEQQRPRAHPTVLGLAELFRAGVASQALLALIDAHEPMDDDAGWSIGALETRARETSAALMQIAAGILTKSGAPLPSHHGRPPSRPSSHSSDVAVDGRVRPGHGENIEAAGTAYGLLSSLRASPRSAQEIPVIIETARKHFALARVGHFGAALPAILPAALVPLYARTLERGGDPARVPLFRRQAIFLRSALSGRL